MPGDIAGNCCIGLQHRRRIDATSLTARLAKFPILLAQVGISKLEIEAASEHPRNQRDVTDRRERAWLCSEPHTLVS